MEMENPQETIERLKQRCAVLEKEKLEFEDKRSRFKDIYQAKERLVIEQHSRLDKMQKKIKEYEDARSSMQMEIDDIKMIASVSENTKQEAVEQLNKRHLEEIESLRKAMEDSNEESQRDMVQHFERERRQWERKLSAFAAEKQNLEAELGDAKNLIKQGGDLSEEEELEESMQKAHAEAEKLKAVVVPLEKEIAKLNDELSDTRTQLQAARQTVSDLNAKSSKTIEGVPQDGEKNQDTSVDSQPLMELDHSLKIEKSSRTDLEMYVDVIHQQKKALEEETDAMKTKLNNVCRQFEVEKAEHAVLKQTWLAANDQFLEAQRLLMRDSNIIEGVLNEDQRRQVKMLKLKAQASEARDAPAKSPMSSHALLKKKTEEFKEAVADRFSNKSDTESDSQSFGSFQDFNDATESDQNVSGGIVMKLNLTSKNEPSTTSMSESEQIHPDMVVPGPGQKVVSVVEWQELLHEVQILRKRMQRSSGIEVETGKKYTDLFDDDAKMAAEVGELQEKLRLVQIEREGDLERTKSLEESIRCSAEDSQKRITDLTGKLTDFERLLGGLREKRIKNKAEDINKLLELTKEKEKLREDLFSLKKDRDRLLSLQQKHQQNLSKESASMPKTPEGLRNLVKMYREALAASQAGHEHTITKLQNEIAFLQDRLKAEQNSKDQLETSLASELHDARGEILSLQSLRSAKEDLAHVIGEKEELQKQLERSKMSNEVIRTKSNEIIKGLREKILAEIKAKEDVESSLTETKTRLRSMQSALETSEHVQRDFVRLSQSLQVQLEEVREEREKEKGIAENLSVHSLDISSAGHSLAEQTGSASGSNSASPQSERKSENKKA